MAGGGGWPELRGNLARRSIEGCSRGTDDDKLLKPIWRFMKLCSPFELGFEFYLETS